MRTSLGLLAFAGLATLAAARLVPLVLGDFSKALQTAPTLKADYTVQTIGGTASRYSVALKKPNLMRVETPTQVFVSDGKDLTTLDKADGVYYKQPASNELVAGILSPEALNVWAGFFDPKALSPATSKPVNAKSIGGQSLDGVQATYDAKGSRVVTYFLAPQDKVARAAQIDLTNPGGKTTIVVSAKNVQVGTPLDADLFAFKAPEGSRETTLEELSAAKWLTDLNEAKALAAKTGKRIFVDFMATWCGPCKMLDRDVLETERFKDLAKKKLVLLRIDVDAQKSIASMYNIEAMPTQMVLAADGSVVASTVGYGGPDAFYSFLTPALG